MGGSPHVGRALIWELLVPIPSLPSYWECYWESYWDRSLLIFCSQDICCVCSQDICIVSSQDICIVSSQGICIEDICILSHLNDKNYDMRAAAPRGCCGWWH